MAVKVDVLALAGSSAGRPGGLVEVHALGRRGGNARAGVRGDVLLVLLLLLWPVALLLLLVVRHVALKGESVRARWAEQGAHGSPARARLCAKVACVTCIMISLVVLDVSL